MHGATDEDARDQIDEEMEGVAMGTGTCGSASCPRRAIAALGVILVVLGVATLPADAWAQHQPRPQTAPLWHELEPGPHPVGFRVIHASGPAETEVGGRLVTAPFLNVCRWPHDEYNDYFAEHLRGPLLRVGFEQAIHFDFQNWPAYQAFRGATEPSSMSIRSVEEARSIFQSTGVVTRLFLDSTLKLDPEAAGALRDPANIAELTGGLGTVAIQR
ncbi:MAG: hypothetical protein HKN73_09030 [Gemmatimonadetes bacterium]|nr:hypothetical protein [Gemmatimonadota bacterium]